jgi:hypothetical protein
VRRSLAGTLSLAAVLVMSAMFPLGPATLAGDLAGVTLPDTLEAGEKRSLTEHAAARR